MRLGKWTTVRELGSGGQGTAYLALDTDRLDLDALVGETRQLIIQLNAIVMAPEASQRNAYRLLELVETYLHRDSGNYSGALKLLHETARADEKARARLHTELGVLRALDHPAVVPILDAAEQDGWYVTPYYRHGTLADRIGQNAGRVDRVLDVFRPLVEGVAELHKRRVVHRDIKPENIFVSEGRLILGDFGIVWFSDGAKTRVSDTYENVGSRDWMPGWAMGMRVDKVRPSFDVFSLGKILWAMASGRTKMRLWYFDHPDFDLTRQFPKDEKMVWINRILAGAVREHEEQVWPDAAEFLRQLDEVIAILGRGAQVIAPGVYRYCRVCGIGVYELLVREGRTAALNNLGFRPANEKLRVFECRNCGHLDVFRVSNRPPAWTDLAE